MRKGIYFFLFFMWGHRVVHIALSSFWWGRGIFKRHKKTFWGGMNMFTILMVMLVSQLHTHVKTYQVMHFIVYQLYPNRAVKKDSPLQRATVKIKWVRASLVAQWLRVCLPMQETRVRALVWEDPTCRGTTGPVSHNYWACASGACAPQHERPR